MYAMRFTVNLSPGGGGVLLPYRQLYTYCYSILCYALLLLKIQSTTKQHTWINIAKKPNSGLPKILDVGNKVCRKFPKLEEHISSGKILA